MSTSVAIKDETRILIAEKQTELLKKGIKISVGELADISIQKGLILIDEKIKEDIK